MIIKLRGHHLVCLCYFIGRGYSSDFIENMSKIWKFLKSCPNLKNINIVCGFDDLCSCCPNKFKNSEDVLQTSYFNFEGCSSKNSLNRDKAYLNLFRFKIGSFVSFAEVSKKESSLVSDYVFSKFCGSCRWFKLCVSIRSKVH